MSEPLAISLDEDTEQVTAVICHTVHPGREQGYEVTRLGVFLTIPISNHLLIPLLSEFPTLLEQLIGTEFSVVLLT